MATETWLSPDKTDGEVRESGHFCRDYIIHRRYRQTPSRGGGVFITVLNDGCKERESEFKLEWLSIKVCREMENHPLVTWALRRLAKKKHHPTRLNINTNSQTDSTPGQEEIPSSTFELHQWCHLSSSDSKEWPAENKKTLWNYTRHCEKNSIGADSIRGTTTGTMHSEPRPLFTKR